LAKSLTVPSYAALTTEDFRMLRSAKLALADASIALRGLLETRGEAVPGWLTELDANLTQLAVIDLSDADRLQAAGVRNEASRIAARWGVAFEIVRATDGSPGVKTRGRFEASKSDVELVFPTARWLEHDGDLILDDNAIRSSRAVPSIRITKDLILRA